MNQIGRPRGPWRASWSGQKHRKNSPRANCPRSTRALSWAPIRGLELRLQFRFLRSLCGFSGSIEAQRGWTRRSNLKVRSSRSRAELGVVLSPEVSGCDGLGTPSSIRSALWRHLRLLVKSLPLSGPTATSPKGRRPRGAL